LTRQAHNVIANLAGQGGGAAVTLFFTPFLFGLFGADRVGVLLFFATVATLAAFVDLGLATTVNRKIAEARGRGGDPNSTQEFVWSAGAYYLASSIVIGVAIVVFAESLCRSWPDIPPDIQAESTIAMRIWGGGLLFRLPITFLCGILNGYERQVVSNLTTFTFSVGRNLCAISVASLAGPSLIGYALVYGFWTLLEFALISAIVFRSLPQTVERPRPSLRPLIGEAAFTIGVAVTTICALAIKMTDKIIVSGSLPVGDFALYQSLFLLCSGVTLVSASVMRAFYPEFSRLKDDNPAFSASYHKAAQLISTSTGPIAAFFIINAELLLQVWTQSADLAERGTTLFRVVVLAVAINSVMQAPQYLAWSTGSSRITAINNVVGMFLIVPLTIVLIKYFGLVGGGLAWLIYNVLYLIFFPSALHRGILPGEAKRWYMEDVGKPFLASALYFSGFYFLPTTPEVRAALSFVLLLTLLGSVGVRLLGDRRN